MNWKRVSYFIVLLIVIAVNIIFLVDLIQAVTTAWTPIEVEFVSSEGYFSNSDNVEVRYKHHYQGIVNGKTVIFTESDQILETGNDRTILVNIVNPKEYEMFDNEQSLMVWKSCAMAVTIFISIFLIYVLSNTLGRR